MLVWGFLEEIRDAGLLQATRPAVAIYEIELQPEGRRPNQWLETLRLPHHVSPAEICSMICRFLLTPTATHAPQRCGIETRCPSFEGNRILGYAWLFDFGPGDNGWR